MPHEAKEGDEERREEEQKTNHIKERKWREQTDDPDIVNMLNNINRDLILHFG